MATKLNANVVTKTKSATNKKKIINTSTVKKATKKNAKSSVNYNLDGIKQSVAVTAQKVLSATSTQVKKATKVASETQTKAVAIAEKLKQRLENVNIKMGERIKEFKQKLENKQALKDAESSKSESDNT